jgi:hypothetical protein
MPMKNRLLNSSFAKAFQNGLSLSVVAPAIAGLSLGIHLMITAWWVAPPRTPNPVQLAKFTHWTASLPA